jgi:hypothetical protein
MKTTFCILLSIFAYLSSFAQTTATDFQLEDCDGNQQHLFGEMDAGKVVVLVWVMPCSSCKAPAKTAYDVAKKLETDYPGRIIYYLIDDYANTTCTSLKNWGTTNVGTGIDAFFSDTNIKMSDYGADGMPKVVVAGGSSHTIYYNRNNTAANNATAIESAIIDALGVASVYNKVINSNEFLVYPNPTVSTLFVSGVLATHTDVQVSIYSLRGEEVYTSILPAQAIGPVKLEINIATIPEGLYLLTINGRASKIRIAR